MKTPLLSAALATSILLSGCAGKLHSIDDLGGAAAPWSDALLATPQGHAVALPGPAHIKTLPKVDYRKVILPGPQYIISDDPEYIRVPEGVALREDVEPGTVRLYVYNVNGVKEPAEMPRRISAVIENRGDRPMRLRMLRNAFPQPSGNYFHIGKTGLMEYFTSRPENEGRRIAPGEAIPIDPAMEDAIVVFNDLVHGFYEFVIDQPGRIHIVQTSPEESGPSAALRLGEVLQSPRANAGRGVFGVSNYLVLPAEEGDALDPARGPMQLVMADGNDDPWVLGIDGATGEVAELRGNYGVMYEVELPMQSTNGQGYALVTYNYRHGDMWCDGMANTIVVGEGLLPAGPVSVPTNKLATKSFPEVVLLQVFPPDAQVVRFTYSPPGASCLPTPLVFLPVTME